MDSMARRRCGSGSQHSAAGAERAGTFILCCENQGAHALQHFLTSHQRAGHIAMAHHFVRERMACREIKVLYFSTEDMVAELFIKALTKHTEFAAGLGWWTSRVNQ
jgi:hypothetical protein